jgi:pyruvate formate lyase activating enzyme
MDSALHRQLTGVSNERILSNIRLLANLPADDKENIKREVWFRVPLIKGVNADETNIAATAQFIAGLKDTHIKELKIHLLPYHDIGKDKHRRRGTVYNPDHILMETPTDEEISQCRSCFERLGIKVVIGG